MQILLHHGDGKPYNPWEPGVKGEDAQFSHLAHGLPRITHPTRADWFRPVNVAAWRLSLAHLPRRCDRLLHLLANDDDLWLEFVQ